MQGREKSQRKQIDPLGVVALCIVIAIIVGCVIAQVLIFKATNWKLLPRKSAAVEARPTPAQHGADTGRIIVSGQ